MHVLVYISYGLDGVGIEYSSIADDLPELCAAIGKQLLGIKEVLAEYHQKRSCIISIAQL